MKLLRDGSGHILALRNPFSLWNKTAAVIEHHPLTPTPKPAVSAPTIVRAVTTHCCFICHWCASPILLEHGQMGQPFGHPTVRKIEVRTIAAVCQSCRLIASYSLFRGCSGFDTRHRLQTSTVSGSTFVFDWLKCDAEGCPFRVPFFVNFDRDLSPGEKARAVANWIWQDLVCMSGHRIYKPASLPGLSARRQPQSRGSSRPGPKARLA